MKGEQSERLHALLSVLRRRQPVPDELATWLINGFEQWLGSDRTASLEHALNLHEKTDYEELRDEHLRRAAELVCEGSKWKRSIAMSEATYQFWQTIWTQIRDCKEPPQGTSALRVHLWHAFKANDQLPTKKGERRFPMSKEFFRQLLSDST